MRYLSLFSGIGGFELGIQQACQKRERGTVLMPECVGFSEIDKYAIEIYQKHFPEQIRYESHNKSWLNLQGTEWRSIQPEGDKSDFESWSNQQSETWWDRVKQQPKNFIKQHHNYGDITKINAEELPDFDLLVGGFPCQAFSIAGKRAGFSDTRGALFFEIARILQSKKTRLFLLENVKGLLSHDNGRTFKTIISTLDELGYDLQWQVLNSKNFGVPQNRERVFIVGHLRGTSRPEVFPITGQSNENSTVSKSAKTAVARTLTGGGHTGGNHSGMTVLRRPLKFLDRNQRNIEGDYAFTVDSMNTGGVKVEGQIRRLTPTECERLQGFPDGWTEGVSDTQRYKCLGNAVTVNVIQAIMEKLLWTSK